MSARSGQGDDDDGSTSPRYHVRFTFDSDVRCAITIHYFCTEELHSCGVTYASRSQASIWLQVAAAC